MSWKAQDRYSRDLEVLKKKHGVNVQQTPLDIQREQLNAWDKVLKDFMKDPFFAKVVNSQKAWAKRVGAYENLNSPDYLGAYKHYFG